MSHKGWRRHADADAALDELLDAAGLAFAELGVGRATMTDVARYANCSRATLYRYFPSQDALHLAFVHRATLRIAGQMAVEGSDGTTASLTDRILAGIAAVRSDPLLSVWFEPENMGVPIRVSQSSELLLAMSVGTIDHTEPSPRAREEIEQRGEWLLRSIVSLLAMPGKDDATERAMVESFVVPLLVQSSDIGRGHL
ncbi:MAG: TetR/AcrR family transcriptional regulator [Acidimicrobiales bacterium]